MKTVTLVNQKRTGLFAEHTHGVAAPTYEVRATIPAVELLLSAGAIVERLPLPQVGYKVTLAETVPGGIVAVRLNGPSPNIGLRKDTEPEYPMEFNDYWAQVDFTPCPVCAAPVVWYEAGYVPGYRVCAKAPHHHSLAK